VSLSRRIDLIVLIVLALIATAGYLKSRDNEQKAITEGFARLETVLSLRESALRVDFESLSSEIRLWSGFPLVAGFMEEFNAAYAQLGEAPNEQLRAMYSGGEVADGAQLYAKQFESLHERARAFAEHHKYYDLFFIDPAGNVVYSLAKEEDFATNLVTGPYRNSGLGQVFRAAIGHDNPDAVAFADFAAYAPTANQTPAFIASQVYRETGEVVGVFAVQVPESWINSVLQFDAGLGETGEIFLVGEDRFMRGESDLFPVESTLESKVGSESVAAALSGDSGVHQVKNTLGVTVLSAFAPIEFEGVYWAMVVEQELDEIREPMVEKRNLTMKVLSVPLLLFLLIRLLLVFIPERRSGHEM
jgi:methyl-accepting chemotaxis protein